MANGRNARRPPQQRPLGEDEPRLAIDVLREFGDTWSRLAWHARVWSTILIEIPTQLHELERALRIPIAERLRFVRAHWPGDDEETRLEAELMKHHRPDAVIDGDARRATIMREVGEWPDRMTIAVDFALNGGGEMSIRCRNTSLERPKLPAVLLGPRDDRTAHEEATRLVRAAIVLVAAPATELPRPPSAA
jgi:hypothetical protein